MVEWREGGRWREREMEGKNAEEVKREIRQKGGREGEFVVERKSEFGVGGRGRGRERREKETEGEGEEKDERDREIERERERERER